MRLVKNLDNGTSRTWKTPLSNYACAIRPVAAIMVTKIDDFSDLMDISREAGMQMLAKSYRLQEYYFNHHGCTRVVKMGDIIIASFPSSEQAVRCAVKIQRGAQKMFNHKLRIGIHMGEVRYVENDLFGSPLNIASDLQELAAPGQVLVSATVAHSLDPDSYAMEMQVNCQSDTTAAFEVKSRITEETSFIGYADSVDTRQIGRQWNWDPYKAVSGS